MSKTSLAFLAALLVVATASATSPERYLHVRVSNPTTHELVRVNLPLSLAEKVLPAINHGQLQNGKVMMGNFSADSVDLRQILDALKTAPEGEFVTVQDKDENVRVAKERGQLIVRVTDDHGKENVSVTIPWSVAEALISSTKDDQLNIAAGIKALESIGDTTLVTVMDHDESVRVWIDSNSGDSAGTK
jgi:hypothetical protein